MFVDEAKILIKAGDGGDGCVSFHREKYVPTGGPNGGDGGNGGNIIFRVSDGMRTLMDFRRKRQYKAENGKNGQGDNSKGKQGSDIIINVPIGTLIKDFDTDKVIADLNQVGKEKIVLFGGHGGKGNARFATPTRQAPNFAQNGVKVQEIWIKLELKTIADVGLIGFPNVGKSTILSVITSARPKIANYHFTTITPNLGVVEQQGRSFVLADIPGLIEGAYLGNGLGHDFLRHIERTRLLIHVLDMSGSEGRNPIEDFHKINRELEKYSSILRERTQFIVANKMDILGADELLIAFKQEVESEGYQVYPASATTGKGFNELIWDILNALEKLPPVKEYAEELLPDKSVSDAYTIREQDGVYILAGNLIDKITRSINFSDDDSLKYFQRSLRRRGIIAELRKNGVKDGDTIRINDFEFEFLD